MRRPRPPLLAVAVVIALAAPAVAQAAARGWEPSRPAEELRSALADSERALLLGDTRGARAGADRAARAFQQRLEPELAARSPAAATALGRELAQAVAAARSRDTRAFAAARARAWTTLLRASSDIATRAARSGGADRARAWLIVREYRRPTRFSRHGPEATLALEALAAGRTGRSQAAAAVRADLLSTYETRMRETLALLDEAQRLGFTIQVAGTAALARGYFEILTDAYVRERGRPAAARMEQAFAALAEEGLSADARGVRAARERIDRGLEAFRAVPLSEMEQVRRAGLFLRFLALVPIEYGRGVEGGRVTLDFEIQEAVSFRDAASTALVELEPILARRDRVRYRRMETELRALGADLAAAARRERVSPPEAIERRSELVLELAETTFPEPWQEADGAADFEVIAAGLDRLEAAVAAGQYSRAEQARLEAYAVFEFGPEQRLRGLAPSLFVEVEGLFWYGADGVDGLAQLVRRRSTPADLAPTRAALDSALADSAGAIGSGAGSRVTVVTNTAVIVFREGLEAVLILAALIAGLTGARRRFRRPLLLGSAGALLATAVTWIAAQTVLSSLTRYGEKLEAVVSLVAIGVLLLVLNWFYHRVYWTEHLAQFHRRKRTLLGGAGLSVAFGLVALGFSSVYREGFETVLFLQAVTLEAGVVAVLPGVGIGLAATVAVGLLTIVLERKLPHKRMLIATGLLITWVLVIMVGTTVQTLQVVGWIPVSPIADMQLPYWAGLWLGVYPTWQGIGAQAGALVFVLGSYAAAEHLRRRRVRRVREAPVTMLAKHRREDREPAASSVSAR